MRRTLINHFKIVVHIQRVVLKVYQSTLSLIDEVVSFIAIVTIKQEVPLQGKVILDFILTLFSLGFFFVRVSEGHFVPPPPLVYLQNYLLHQK